MSRKRSFPAPLPIFNQGIKRPRQALLAHPNNSLNQGVVPQEPMQLKPAQSNSYGSSMKENCRPCFFPAQEQRASGVGGGRFTPSSYPQARQRSSQPLPSAAQNWFKDQNSVTTGFHQSFSAEPNVPATAVGNSNFQAKEPVEAASFEQPQVQKTRSLEARVLTATAQGIEHWSQYTQYTRLLFEVYGTLVAQSHEKVAQKFTLKTADGPLNCVFWEMERQFPSSLGQLGGQHQVAVVRVVGEWQANSKTLKAYSVRLALEEEEGTARQCVMGADRQMRKMVAKL